MPPKKAGPDAGPQAKARMLELLDARERLLLLKHVLRDATADDVEALIDSRRWRQG